MMMPTNYATSFIVIMLCSFSAAQVAAESNERRIQLQSETIPFNDSNFERRILLSSSRLDDKRIKKSRLSESELEMRGAYMERQRVRDAALDGCLKGAIAGAIGGAIFGAVGGDKKVETKEVVLGGVAGCAVGASIGSARGKYVHAKTQDYAHAQQAERELIASLDEDIAYFTRMNNHTANLVESERQKIADLNVQYETKAITVKEYNKRIASKNGNIKAVRETVADISTNIELVNTDIAKMKSQGIRTADFETRLAELQEQRAQLLEGLDELQSTYDAIPAEVISSAT